MVKLALVLDFLLLSAYSPFLSLFLLWGMMYLLQAYFSFLMIRNVGLKKGYTW